MRASVMRWHRRAGLAAAILVTLAAATGVLINHADALGLPGQRISAPWILRWWGVHAPRLQTAYPVSSRWISQWGSRIHLDDAPLDMPPVEGVVGATALDDGLWAIADRKQMLLLTPAGALVDQLPYPSGFVAGRLGHRRAGSSGLAFAAVVEGADGRRLLSDAQGTTLQPLAGGDDAPVQWSVPGELPATWRAHIERATPQAELSAERVLLDVHSGRWLGPWGVWLMDAAAVLLCLLAATGAWSALRGNASARKGRTS